MGLLAPSRLREHGHGELEDTGYDRRRRRLLPGRGYEHGRVFHGGWGRHSYIANTRIANATGEHPIYPLCDDGPIEKDD